MEIDRFFEAGSVVAELASVEKISAIRELVHRAPVFRQIPNLAQFEEAVIARERVQSTGFGHGVAVAHGRIPGLARVLIGFGLSRAGIPFDAVDGKPVHLLFVIASPPHLSLDYLQALSTLVRCLRDRPIRESILACPGAREMEARIREALVTDLGRQACQATG
ncbi:MAG TPA: PTS sugar transporter subunit IIA [Spirochaetia bacterium]|nr:PTS sugar transporter subunit IIA [Spirochaetia bacterium]